MSVVAITGNDTLIINGRVLVDFFDQDNAVLTRPNDMMTGKTGKNGNAIIAMNHAGRVAELTVRVVRGSSDDAFLNDLQIANINNFPATQGISGSLVKNLGDNQGNVGTDTYKLTNGFFKKQSPDAKENADGDTEQGVSVHMLSFLGCDRSIG